MKEILNKIDIEEIYKAITDLEGPKYPLDNMEKLNEAADYLVSKLESYGIATDIQEFFIEGMEKPFRNIIGRIGSPSEPATLIGSHYDTVRNSPGANDNLSSIAVSLEVARILNRLPKPPSVLIAFFTLEEGHPAVRKELDERLLKLGVIDKKFRFSSAKLLRFNKMLRKRYLEMTKNSEKNVVEIYNSLYAELQDKMTIDESDYLEVIIDVYKKYLQLSPINQPSYTVGSYRYAESIDNIKEKIKEVIVYDCLGWVYPDSDKASQLPLDDNVKQIAKTFNVELNDLKRNFIAVIGEKNSTNILNSFLESCQDKMISMDHLGLCLPFEYDVIEKKVKDVLRSDHWPFWKKGIPGIFISDMANFRSDYYHTPADLSQYINYEALKKVAMATLKTLLSRNLR